MASRGSPATKLRTRIYKLDGHNRTWNEKFLFDLTRDFLAGLTSDTFCDYLVGIVRFLIGNMFSPDGTPCFQIRCPSRRFHGVMNIDAMVMDSFDFPMLEKISAISAF